EPLAKFIQSTPTASWIMIFASHMRKIPICNNFWKQGLLERDYWSQALSASAIGVLPDGGGHYA
ncbi:MAG: hypothetical protein ACWGMZ_11125, partial [Thermoguttaceae bacterium]